MCARKKEIYRCRNANEDRVKLTDLVYKKGGYWALMEINGVYMISNYTSKKNRVIMEAWV